MNESINILRAVAAGGRIRLETLQQRNEGGFVNVSRGIAPITGKNGTIVASSFLRDNSSRKRMEEALRRSEERFRLVARATKDIIWDWEGERIWRSETCWEHFGYSPRVAEPDMAGWIDLLHPEDRERVWNGFQTALSRQSDSYEVEYRFRRADASYAVVMDRAYIVYDETGLPTRAIGAITDLSDRRELEGHFRQALKMEAVGRLAGGVAHDFNNLLMVITGYTEIMQKQLGSQDDVRKNLTHVQKAARTAASLTQQLLAFSRQQVLAPRIIDLNSVIEDGLKMIHRLIGEDKQKQMWMYKRFVQCLHGTSRV
jgi:PAS domain S-box-containing protein